MRSNYGEILKPRKPQYVETERLIIRRKRRMRALYDAGNHPGIDSLLRYSSVQAWRSTEPFEETQQNPRFVLQNVEPAPAQPPTVIPEPIIAPIQPIVPLYASFFAFREKCTETSGPLIKLALKFSYDTL
uniref:Uncharacterized protein n=1 Tax=Panagrolaimus davidi TaxID=227884 RepID=A0A914QDI4_9BILA